MIADGGDAAALRAAQGPASWRKEIRNKPSLLAQSNGALAGIEVFKPVEDCARLRLPVLIKGSTAQLLLVSANWRMGGEVSMGELSPIMGPSHEDAILFQRSSRADSSPE